METEFKFTAEPGKQETVITCIVNAPRELVFKTYTDPILLPQWWGPKFLTMETIHMDVKPGGKWRFVQKDANGNEHAFHGMYREIVLSERIVQTFEFEGEPGYVLLETITFEEHNGKTKIIDQSIFQSLADRDGMLGSGMEAMSSESMSNLAELLAKIGKTS